MPLKRSTTVANVNGCGNLSVEGHRSDDVAARLSTYTLGSLTAKEHLIKAGQQGVKIKVETAVDKHTAASLETKIVTLNWNECNQKTKEAAESALFEIQNILNNTDQFKNLAIEGKRSIIQMAGECAKAESKSTDITNTILNELVANTRYRPSIWGVKQMVDRGGANIRDYSRRFAKLTHSNRPGAPRAHALPSVYFYVHEWLKDRLLASRSSLAPILDRMVKVRTNSGFFLLEDDIEKIIFKIDREIEYFYRNDDPVVFFVYYMTALRVSTIQNGVNIHWNSSGDVGTIHECCANMASTLNLGIEMPRVIEVKNIILGFI